MKLKKILNNIPDIKFEEDIEISNIFSELNKFNEFKKTPKSSEKNTDGKNILYLVRDKKHLFKNGIKKTIVKPIKEMFEEIKEVLKEKVSVLVISDKVYNDENFNLLFNEIIEYTGTKVIAVSNILAVEAVIATNYYSNPSLDMKIIGVYGDENGELTSEYIKNIYETSNIPVEYINERYEYIKGPIDFQSMLYAFKKSGIKNIIVNTSAISLKTDMYLGTIFESGVFTDISEDRKYWQENFEKLDDYLNAVLKLFVYPSFNIINNDDYASDFIKNVNPKHYTHGIVNKSTYNATDVNIRGLNTNYIVIVDRKVERISISMSGMDAVYASLAALNYALNSGLNFKNIKHALEKAYLPYQKEMLQNDLELQILLDKTNDPDKIDKILKETKKLVTGRIVVLVSRDGLDIYDDLPIKIEDIKKFEKQKEENIEEVKQKIREELKKKEELINKENSGDIQEEEKTRLKMGEVLSRHADIGIITIGNSKFENQNKIIKDIEKGVNKKKTKLFKYLNREEAIISSLYNIQKRDLIAIFGMGEKPLNIKGKKEYINQKEIIKKYLEENKNDILIR